MIRVRAARREDAEYIARNARQSDRDEVAFSSGEMIEKLLPRAWAMSNICLTISNRFHLPIAIYGVVKDVHCTPRSYGSGQIWMLATDNLREERHDFLRKCKSLLVTAGHMVKCDLLWNKIWTKSPNLAWLKWMGFKLHVRRAYPIRGEDFYPFHIWTPNIKL